MVRIISYKARQRENGTTFCALEVQGGIEMVLSQKTNQYYATAKKTFISSTFDEETCKALIGTELQGNVQKEECEPYEYVIKETGESIIMQHRFVYVPESSVSSGSVKSNKASSYNFEADLENFSTNGKYDHVLAD
ncbi:hypothetical protein LXM63_19665 [Chryseobacterium gleum]|uniref:hypothetical protein n=1 Tax=Chryseobacterium gleum TaxID=250 RepID=UPI001E3DF05B|nr:hypothetical protein [Chryseobacterium gleum]MCE4067315.1 hypothetical protein [Chryseobacterium gleum]